jgi:hypothetical protein
MKEKIEIEENLGQGRSRAASSRPRGRRVSGNEQ